MSRTFRLKTDEQKPRIYVKDEHSLMSVLHRYYGDRNSGERNAPAFYRVMLNRKNRAQNKEIINSIKKKDLDLIEELVFIPMKRSANWEWF